jgi:hydrogenase maturation protease
MKRTDLCGVSDARCYWFDFAAHVGPFGPFRTARWDKTMNSFEPDIIVAGFGGPRGDVQAAWRVLTLLSQRQKLGATLIRCDQHTQLVGQLDDCGTLIAIDASRGGSEVGSISRFQWPDPRIRQYHNHSVHGIRLCNTLQLAERLGQLPPTVEVFGIDIGGRELTDVVSPDVEQAVVEVERAVFAKICEAVDARAVVC